MGGTWRGTVPRASKSGSTAPRPVQAEMRDAIRQVTAAYNALPPATQVRVGPAVRDGLDAEVRAANAAGDSERALAAIRAWRGHWLATFEGAR
ncbi:MAG: hypothetical protein ACRDLL_03295 [Solirubrobacterales bacterium]